MLFLCTMKIYKPTASIVTSTITSLPYSPADINFSNTSPEAALMTLQYLATSSILPSYQTFDINTYMDGRENRRSKLNLFHDHVNMLLEHFQSRTRLSVKQTIADLVTHRLLKSHP